MHHAHTAPSLHARHHTHAASEPNPNKIIVNPVKNFALLATTLIQLAKIMTELRNF